MDCESVWAESWYNRFADTLESTKDLNDFSRFILDAAFFIEFLCARTCLGNNQGAHQDICKTAYY